MSSESMSFRTELKQLLDLIIHSLYSHPDIFLRELISNASDAIDTLRFESLTKPEIVEGGSDWKIKLMPDSSAGTLTVSDNGIGMTREEIIENLGTIARSGTRAFLESLRQAEAQSRPELIGQFGVGFYSAFMVADRVTVVSRKAGQTGAVRWESDGQGEFKVESAEKPSRGTDVILHLKADARDFLDEWKLREVVKKYSDFVEHPIVMDVTREKDKTKTVVEETLNSQKALWLRPRSEASEEDYNNFYQHLAHDWEKPAQIIHYTAEGTIEFRALLYIPAHKTPDLLFGDGRKGLHLYIRRVFIMDDSEALLPLYLRFVKGVVDSPDLPLNVSREILQKSAPLEKIKSNLVSKVLRTFADMQREDLAKYTSVFRELGTFLKEGVYQDRANREQLADLLLYESTRTEPGKLASLRDYVDRMPADQNEIYYLIGETRDLLEQSPYIEAFKEKGQEVLLMTEPIDEFVAQGLTEYKGKKLKAADRGELAGGQVEDEQKKRFGPLLDYMKQKLADVKEVRLTRRLRDSAACLVADEWAMGAHMERLMQRMGRAAELPPAQRILELNPDHPAVAAMQKLHEKNAQDDRLEKYSRILYDEAVLAEGSRLKDPADFARRVNELLAKDAAS